MISKQGETTKNSKLLLSVFSRSSIEMTKNKKTLDRILLQVPHTFVHSFTLLGTTYPLSLNSVHNLFPVEMGISAQHRPTSHSQLDCLLSGHSIPIPHDGSPDLSEPHGRSTGTQPGRGSDSRHQVRGLGYSIPSLGSYC